ncbi:hypothetical protein F5Y16DRAFT_388264 [Xylariaceae sp. FL0255]|nr:hypothetical protein F5Y16DRAFT_388264 [Xylariaceae sp. FL0255]
MCLSPPLSLVHTSTPASKLHSTHFLFVRLISISSSYVTTQSVIVRRVTRNARRNSRRGGLCCAKGNTLRVANYALGTTLRLHGSGLARPIDAPLATRRGYRLMPVLQMMPHGILCNLGAAYARPHWPLAHRADVGVLRVLHQTHELLVTLRANLAILSVLVVVATVAGVGIVDGGSSMRGCIFESSC